MPVDRTNLKARGFDRRRLRVGSDLCDLLQVGVVADGPGQKLADTAVLQNVPCVYSELSEGSPQIGAGGVTVIATHRIEMKRSTEALALRVHDKIKVLARTGKPQLIFEHPVRQEGSFTPLVEFRAVCVTSGYRSPGIT